MKADGVVKEANKAAVLEAIRKGCKERSLLALTTQEISEITGLSPQVVGRAIKSLRYARKVMPSTYAAPDNPPTCIGHGWTTPEIFQAWDKAADAETDDKEADYIAWQASFGCKPDGTVKGEL